MSLHFGQNDRPNRCTLRGVARTADWDFIISSSYNILPTLSRVFATRGVRHQNGKAMKIL
jgi:hypothetical protein